MTESGVGHDGCSCVEHLRLRVERHAAEVDEDTLRALLHEIEVNDPVRYARAVKESKKNGNGGQSNGAVIGEQRERGHTTENC